MLSTTAHPATSPVSPLTPETGPPATRLTPSITLSLPRPRSYSSFDSQTMPRSSFKFRGPRSGPQNTPAHPNARGTSKTGSAGRRRGPEASVKGEGMMPTKGGRTLNEYVQTFLAKVIAEVLLSQRSSSRRPIAAWSSVKLTLLAARPQSRPSCAQEVGCFPSLARSS